MSKERDRALEEFTKPGPLPEGANLPNAEARLLAALEKGIGVTIAPKVVRSPRAPRLLALAALFAATAGLVWSLASLKQEREKPVLRGPAESSRAWNGEPKATPLGGGRLGLAWSPAPGATRYAVIFLGEDLNELAQVESLDTTTLTLDAGALPAGLSPGQAVLWRVTAYEGRDEIARSVTSPLQLP